MTSCEAICADVVERYSHDMQRSIAVNVRVARCVQTECASHCETVIELDGRCYVGGWIPTESTGYDCSLSDAVSCPAPAPRTCVTAEECPGGLACNGGQCGAFTGNSGCAVGEVCILQLCLLEGQAACADSFGCPAGEDCYLSGIDAAATRGNATTTSFCQPYVQ